MTAVASGTARGKDFVVAACGSLCFMYLTPTFDERGRLVGNTKGRNDGTHRTTGREYHVARGSTPIQGCAIASGRLVAFDIRTDYERVVPHGFPKLETTRPRLGLVSMP